MKLFRIVGPYLMLASSICAADDCATLLPTLEHSATQEPNNINALLNLGVNRFRCGMPASALEPLRKVAELAPAQSAPS